MDGDDVIHALATAIDTQLGAAASGTIASISSSPTVFMTVTITFPAGRFTSAPVVVVTRTASNAAAASTSFSVAGITATGATIGVYQSAGSASTAGANWLAVTV